MGLPRRARTAFISLAIAFAVTFASASGSSAATVSLAWDANPPEEAVVAYRVFECPKLSLIGCAQRQEVTTTQTDLDVDYGTHCWRATAVSTYGLESEFSEEVCVDLNRPSRTNAFRVIVYVPRVAQ